MVKLQCYSYCANFPICLGATKFFIDLSILPLSGADMVLGIQWLNSLGPIITNYDSLSMQYKLLHNLHMDCMIMI